MEAETVGIDQLLPIPFTREQLINAINQGLGISHGSAGSPLRLNANSIFLPLLGEFLDSTLVSIQLCKDSLTLGDVKALRNELHKCKGSSGLYGADELYQTVSDIQEELVVAPYDMDAISTLLTQAERQLKGYHFGQRRLQ
jgi:HPt (histidine-containing phosphotransfer) domain-containing protein